jgi:predicted transcriptional regulator of viral defense system
MATRKRSAESAITDAVIAAEVVGDKIHTVTKNATSRLDSRGHWPRIRQGDFLTAPVTTDRALRTVTQKVIGY